jgi:hypothetical protein
MYIWSPETYAAAQTLTAANGVPVMMTPTEGGKYLYQISGIAAKELDETYYVAAVYTDTNGNVQCTGIIAYSLSRYCMSNANGSMGALAQATAMYGYYADAYFT